MRVTEHERVMKILFEKDGELFCYVTPNREVSLCAGETHTLNGWQKKHNRYNNVLIDGHKY